MVAREPVVKAILRSAETMSFFEALRADAEISVIVPHESNFILNPKHPEFGSIEIGEPISLEMDQRLI